MTEQNASLDETSVPPVSSLRFKFESLAAQQTSTRPSSRNTTTDVHLGNGEPPVIPRKPNHYYDGLRPKSMIDHPLPAHSSILSAGSFAQPGSSFEALANHDGHGTKDDISIPGRASQALEQDGTGRDKADRTVESRQTGDSRKITAPRRPQVPAKKPTLAAKLSEKGILNNITTSSTSSIPCPQPRSTAMEKESAAGVSKARERMNSDASWAERLRTDSDASSHSVSGDVFRDRRRSSDRGSQLRNRTSPKRKTRPSRTDSNASWVETLYTDEPYNPAEDHSLQQIPVLIKEEQGDEEMPNLPPRPRAETSLPSMPPKLLPGITRQQTFPTAIRSDSDPTARLESVHLTKIADQTANTRSRPPSALSQGFGRPREAPNASTCAVSSTASLIAPPAIPAPRRSLDRRRDAVSEKADPAPAVVVQSQVKPAVLSTIGSEAPSSDKSHEAETLSFPEISSYNRRPPRYKQRSWQIPTEYDTRLLTVCGDYVCTSGFITRIWNVRTCELILNVVHPESFRVSALAFQTSPDEIGRVWLGTSNGEVHELDIQSQRIVNTSQRAHKGREVVKIFTPGSELWTLDASGNLVVWKKGHDGMTSLQSNFQLFNTQKGHNASLVYGAELWIATGKDVRVYSPAAKSESAFVVGRISMSQMNIGEITSVSMLETEPDKIYFGHTDGKISICHRRDRRCLSTVHVSLNKIGNLYGVGQYLWAGYGTGVMQVYDTTKTPWNTKKEWQAHSKQISSIQCDASSIQTADSLRVVTLGADGILKLWDGLFEDDFLEEGLKQVDSSYCDFSEITASVLTWNAGAAKPSHLQHRIEDDSFLREYISENAASDILVFGFQELVDLEDKKLTAKSLFKAKKKDAFEQEHMTHQYRAWRDHLTTRVREYTNEDYTNLHTASMIGLFSCIFVKASIRHRIKHVHQAEVKRGMGGHYGNKGALVLRIVLDHTSICLVNCHLAAGQSATASRNSDVAGILEAECLPAYPLDMNAEIDHADIFTSGGDGSVILDHELCILNGDLNYRVDTMSRDTVIKHVQQGSLARLLDRDQLLLSRKKNPGFKLRAFQETQIQFNPTYKYNVNSNDYDTSEKRRSPAWCDRILYRGLGKMKCEQYRRWEVRVSDHRPVSAALTCRVKRVDLNRRAKALQRCIKDFQTYKQEMQRLLLVSA